MAKELQALQSVFVGTVNLETIDHAGQREIGSYLNPQDAIFSGDIVEGGAHGVDTHIGPATEGAGEEPRNALPIAGDVGLRPRDTGHEQQGHTDEDHEQHDILAILDQTGHHDAEEDARQGVGQHEVEKGLPSGEMGEIEQARNHNGQPRAHDAIDHEIAQGLAQDNDKGIVVTDIANGNEVAIGILVAGSTGREADAEHEGLLENQHQHGRKHRRAIAALRIEDGHIVVVERTGGNGFFAGCIGASKLLLDIIAHLHGDGLGGLENGFIGEHQAHVAIDADDALFHAVDFLGKVAGNEVNALDQLSADQRLGLIHILSIIGNAHIG